MKSSPLIAIPRTHYTSMKILLVLLFIVGQLLGIFHLIEHAVEGDNDHCEICAMAAHLGDTVLPEPEIFIIPPLQADLYVALIACNFVALVLAAYRSRAPPHP